MRSDKNVNSLDIWKGLSILGLTFNHLILWPCQSLSGALKFSYQSLGWFSFASVFFAISGCQWGKREQKNPDILSWNILRARKLFAWVVCATLIFQGGVWLGFIQPAPWQAHAVWSRWDLVLSAVLGQKLPWLIDVIWMHGILGVFATVVWSLPWLRVSSARIAALSLVIWICSQLGLFQFQFGHGAVPSWHDWTSWQLLFVGAALLQRKDAAWLRSILRQPPVKIVLLSLAICLFILRHFVWLKNLNHSVIAQSFGLLFAVNTIVICFLAADVKFHIYPKALAHIGRRSLFFYSLQCSVVYLLGGALVFSANQRIASFVIVLLVLGTMIFMTRLSFRRGLYEASRNSENESCHCSNRNS